MGSLYFRRDGTEPDFKGDQLAALFWSIYKKRIVKDGEKWNNERINGKYGGKYRAYRQQCKEKGIIPLQYETWVECYESNTLQDP